MKKYLLLSAAAFAATAGFAQVANMQMEKVTAPKYSPMTTFERMTDNVAAKKSYTNQTYYQPQGGLYLGWNAEGRGTGSAVYLVPPFTDITFTNMMNTPANGVWQMNGTDVTQYAVNGDYVYSLNPNGIFYVPTLINGSVQYQFGENNYYYIQGTITSLANAGNAMTTTAISFSDGTSLTLPIYAVNDHGSRESNGRTYTNTLVGYGFIEGTKFLFGSGTYTNDDATVSKVASSTQFFTPIAAPLYADDIIAGGITFNENGPIPANDSIFAYVTDVDTITSESGNVYYQPGNTIYAKLYATSETTSGFTQSSDDVVSGWAGEGDYEGKNPTTGMVTYYNTDKTIDPIMGTESSNPIVLPEGKAFAITFADLDKTGVNLGFYGTIANDEDNCAPGCVNLDNGQSYWYQSNIGIHAALEGMFEKISIPTKDFLTYESQDGFPASSFYGWNVLRVSADGQTVSTDGLSGTDYDLGAALVGTTFPWVDDNENSNYSVEVEYLSGEDWIESVNYNSDLYDGNSLPGYNLIQPVCSALPTGVTGRTAKLIIHGKADIACPTYVYVLQGDAAESTGINSAVAFDGKSNLENASMFNLSGQKVGKNYKGIVIQNGKKFFNK